MKKNTYFLMAFLFGLLVVVQLLFFPTPMTRIYAVVFFAMMIFMVVCGIKRGDDSKIQQHENISVKTNGYVKPNGVAKALRILAWIVFIGGAIMGIILGNVENSYGYTSFNIAVAIIYWVAAFISGMMFIGFAEIIKLLEDIKNK